MPAPWWTRHRAATAHRAGFWSWLRFRWRWRNQTDEAFKASLALVKPAALGSPWSHPDSDPMGDMPTALAAAEAEYRGQEFHGDGEVPGDTSLETVRALLEAAETASETGEPVYIGADIVADFERAVAIVKSLCELTAENGPDWCRFPACLCNAGGPMACMEGEPLEDVLNPPDCPIVDGVRVECPFPAACDYQGECDRERRDPRFARDRVQVDESEPGFPV